MTHRTTLAKVAAVPLTLGLALAAGPSYAGQQTHRETTAFAFGASGFGTRVQGGQLPAGSSTTAWQGIGCTNRAGLDRTNDVTVAQVPGLGTLHDVRTRVWTTKRAGRVASHASHSIAQIVLADTPLGSLSIDAVRATALAYHDGTGFHASTSTHVGDITLTPAVGPAQTFPAPTPDQPLTIPGVATIYLGFHATNTHSTSAYANAFALRVEAAATGSSIKVAHANASLYGGFTGGIFSGQSAATHVVTAAGSILRSSPQPLTRIPCQGTYGKTLGKSLASVDLGGPLVVDGASATERGLQRTHGRAVGAARAEVGSMDLGDGALVVDDIVARAVVVRDGRHVTRSARGTRLGSITASGKQLTFPRTGVLEIPGLAKLERHVVTRSRNGLHVIGLRITLLDGSGAVINLAEAGLRIRPLPR